MPSQNAQIILDAAKVSAASGGKQRTRKQGQRSQSARALFAPEARCGVTFAAPDII